ncbi:hypothetical protein PCASD_01824 [Puccinia coronata f. sp. avenae]|uniref:Uncharacterized protein n=1 Tax=Puccinia coronata f. sp. avenae TaxID=200324 RepID=A0A2N5VJH8_9BASI|nr:hypothetical protein PCASD_01824 [Puccinia coronata f. sp. avenae]
MYVKLNPHHNFSLHGRPQSRQALRRAQMLCGFIAAELDAAQRSEEDLGPARRCTAPRCSAASLLQSWMRHSALRKTSVLPGAAPRPDALQLHCCRAGCGTAL